MLNFVDKISFKRTITFKIPHGDGYQEEQAIIHFQEMPEQTKQDLKNPETAQDDAYVVSQIVTGWEQIQMQGKEAKFTKKNLSLLTRYTFFVAPIIKTYFEVMAGISEKN